MVVQASKLNLPNPSLSSLHITSLLFEPNSLSLALMHSDSSFSLYPSLSPLHISSLPPPQTIVPSPSSSAAFVLLQNPSPNSRALFVVSGPYGGGSRILLRFYVLRSENRFVRAQVVCNQKDLHFEHRLGVLVDSSHGVSIKLAGSVNFFAMYSVSSSKVWVFAVKLVGGEDDDDGVIVKLMRCAVIECCRLVFSVSISFGWLILGEEKGVRVFNLRQLVKGRVKKGKPLDSTLKPEVRKLSLPNGVIGASVHGDLGVHDNSGGSDQCGKCDFVEGVSNFTCKCHLDEKNHRHHVSVKQRAIRVREDSSQSGACFVAFRSMDVQASNRRVVMSVKAISIQALSAKQFLILDSAGDLHLLHLSNSVTGSNMTFHMQQLPHFMDAQKLAVLPDNSTRARTVWLSDGYHSVHVMVASEAEAVTNGNDTNEIEEKLTQISVIQAIFAEEKIEDVIPLATNAVLILGQVS